MARRTKEEALATRHRLLDAAVILFHEQGVSKTSLEQIAQKAGTTRGAIYWHFKDKADLFNAMLERIVLPMESASRRALVEGGEPLAMIESALVEALRLVSGDAQVRRVFEVVTHKVEYTDEMRAAQQRHLIGRNACWADFERALRLAARYHGVKLQVAASTAARGMHALVSGLIQSWLLDPEAFDLVRTGRRVFDVYLRGLGFSRAEA